LAGVRAKRTGLRLLLGGALLASLLAPVSAPAGWINVQTKNLNLVSNATEKDTRELATRLEQFHAVFTRLFRMESRTSPPTTVVVFKDEPSFDFFRSDPGIQGYFLVNSVEPTMAMVYSGVFKPMNVIHHEYAHALTSDMQQSWPAWLVEGLAEFYATFQVKGNIATVGQAQPHHVRLLRHRPLIPMRHLFTMEEQQHSYTGPFYAQSWALTHYLMLKDRESQRAFGQFVRLTQQGQPDETAFEQAFQIDLKTLQKELANYVTQEAFNAIELTFADLGLEPDVSVRSMTETEVGIYKAVLLVGLLRAGDATAYLKKAEAELGDDARLQATLGLHALMQDRFGDAKEYLRRAIDNGMANYYTHYFRAQAMLMEATDGWKRTEPIAIDTAKAIAAEASASIKLMPTYGYAYHLLGQLCLAMHADLNEGVKMASRAIVLNRRDGEMFLTLARLCASVGEYDNAKKVLKSVLGNELGHPWHKEAREIGKRMDADARTGEAPAAPYLPKSKTVGFRRWR
jgi:hypothetical protein